MLHFSTKVINRRQIVERTRLCGNLEVVACLLEIITIIIRFPSVEINTSFAGASITTSGLKPAGHGHTLPSVPSVQSAWWSHQRRATQARHRLPSLLVTCSQTQPPFDVRFRAPRVQKLTNRGGKRLPCGLSYLRRQKWRNPTYHPSKCCRPTLKFRC